MRKAMGRDARRGAGKADRADLYEEVTARIVAELEAGRLPWVQPWGTTGHGPCLPHNAATVRPYSGINILLLWGAAQERGFAASGWLTFRQALGAGGSVRKGEHGTTVFYADRFIPEGEKARAAESGEDAKAVPFLKRFTVFSVEQCEGLPESLTGSGAPLPESEQVPLAEAVIAASGVPFRIGGSEAYYAPGPDLVTVPPQQPGYLAVIERLQYAVVKKFEVERSLLSRRVDASADVAEQRRRARE